MVEVALSVTTVLTTYEIRPTKGLGPGTGIEAVMWDEQLRIFMRASLRNYMSFHNSTQTGHHNKFLFNLTAMLAIMISRPDEYGNSMVMRHATLT